MVNLPIFEIKINLDFFEYQKLKKFFAKMVFLKIFFEKNTNFYAPS